MEFNSNLKILRKHFMESSEKFRSEEGVCWQNGISASADLPQCFRNASATLPQNNWKKSFYFWGSDAKPLFATAAVRKRLGNDPVADEAFGQRARTSYHHMLSTPRMQWSLFRWCQGLLTLGNPSGTGYVPPTDSGLPSVNFNKPSKFGQTYQHFDATNIGVPSANC